RLLTNLADSIRKIFGWIHDGQVFGFTTCFATNFLREFLESLALLETFAIESRLTLKTFFKFFSDLLDFFRAIEVFLMVLFGHLDHALGTKFFFEGCERGL